MWASKFGLTLAALQLAACSLNPAWRSLAAEGQLVSSEIDTGLFRHRVLANELDGDHLFIYVEGDGTPWIRERRVSVDPTPVNPVMLRLMLPASQAAIYLGRPCYFGLATSPGCHSRWWTFERYGRRVVDSMCAAANTLASSARSVSLVGYSGGGAIVVRMSACTDKLASIVTIAGNLDPAAWTAMHGYT
ncbi:MAG: alpha/beta hydrolase, partial [Gammaproteobacteria bacterium]|nr:alpha/beta hydrolase [Gammaproteobacteria bacterium]